MALPDGTETPEHKRRPGRWLWTLTLLACFIAAGAFAGQWIASQNRSVAGREAQRAPEAEPVSNTPPGVEEDEPAASPTE